MTSIIIHYLDLNNTPQLYMIETQARSLMYDDPTVEPIEVRDIAKKGFTIGHWDGKVVQRLGRYIPPHRITRIDFVDDCYA